MLIFILHTQVTTPTETQIFAIDTEDTTHIKHTLKKIHIALDN